MSEIGKRERWPERPSLGHVVALGERDVTVEEGDVESAVATCRILQTGLELVCIATRILPEST